MTSKEIREEYLRFFEEHGHQRVSSASVVPHGDPTLLFTNAGMNQFKDVFLGLGKRDYSRAVDTQKCIRVSGKHNDLEEVGISLQHHTFFEMLGNWSFGDYFKQEAITWGWELVTERWGLDKERLWGTVFEGNEADELGPDEEAEQLWLNHTDVAKDHILRLPAADNFWEMGNSGPCGPCSEFHYYMGDNPATQTPELGLAGITGDSQEWIEIWNLVFIQYNRDESGKLHVLPAKHVDTGMGFERITSILQGVRSNYDTDIFKPLIARIAELSGRDYSGADAVAMRVISDHARALTIAIGDGALPSNEGAGYVLRRILRRAARFGRNLGLHEPFVYQMAAAVADNLGDVFPEIVDKSAHIALVIRSEEENFGKTLDRGLDIFERVSQKGEISGADAFQLYDTYGFPLDLTELMARERGLAVDTEGFAAELETQRQRARTAAKSRFVATEGVEDIIEEEHSYFIGYGELEVEAQIVRAEAGEDGSVRLILDQTPFYAESGGQVGDKGCISGAGFAVDIEETIKGRGGIVHLGRLVQGDLAALRGKVDAAVDAVARQAAARNHTATHLLHEALRRTLGDHVDQMGSLVGADRLRFDFSHFAAVEPEQLRQIQELVNDCIRADLEVATFEEDLEKAKQLGARALFGEKYGDQVRVVQIGDYSLELCGGTHVGATGEIGFFDLTSEGGIAAGTRRAEALTGAMAEQRVRQQRDVLDELGALLNTQTGDLPTKLEALLQHNRELERSLAATQRRLADLEGGELADEANEVEGVKILAKRVEVADVGALRIMADGIRDSMGSGAAVLGAAIDGKVALISVVTDDLVAARKLKAGDIVKQVAQLVGGSGGGKPHLAQAGGRDPEKLDAALEAVEDIVRQQLQ
jgi:alanyl-tRNA synthetase